MIVANTMGAAMSRKLICLLIAVVAVLVVLTASASAAREAIPVRWKNCTVVNKRFPHGVGKLRAYDKTTGQQVGAVWLPAQQSGSPMTYMAEGKQYIVVAVGGGAYTAEYLAFALPADGRRPSGR